MLVYRICRRPFQSLDGEGGYLYGGRWNTPGTPLVYAAGTLALAALEYLVHVDPEDVPPDLIALTIEVPDDAPSDRVLPTALPENWTRLPEHPACQTLGDAWARSGSALALRVPSALVPEEENVLLNPRHRDALRVRVLTKRDFAFDPRLLR